MLCLDSTVRDRPNDHTRRRRAVLEQLGDTVMTKQTRCRKRRWGNRKHWGHSARAVRLQSVAQGGGAHVAVQVAVEMRHRGKRESGVRAESQQAPRAQRGKSTSRDTSCLQVEAELCRWVCFGLGPLHRSILLIVHSCCLLTWRGSVHFLNVAYLLV